MQIFYDDRFVLPLPAEHRFPMRKYALLRDAVTTSPLIAPADLRVPPSATDAELQRVHDAHYCRCVDEGLLSPQEQRRIGFPWSPELGERERLVVGATIAACRAALEDGRAVNLAGGTHHAFRDHGAGYCVFNDSAVAARAMQAEGRARRIVIIDCDVHQGDGTAALFAGDESVFTFSLHGAKNYPFHKQQSNLDIGLDDGADDTTYLAALKDGLHRALALARADLAIYVAGVDPYVGDQLGRLAVSQAGLAARDHMVFDACDGMGVPVVTTMAGGYASDLAEIVALHLQTIHIAAQRSHGMIAEGRCDKV